MKTRKLPTIGNAHIYPQGQRSDVVVDGPGCRPALR